MARSVVIPWMALTLGGIALSGFTIVVQLSGKITPAPSW